MFIPNRLLIGFNALGPTCPDVVVGWLVGGTSGKGKCGFSGLLATRASIEKDLRFSSVDDVDFGEARSGSIDNG